MNRKNLTAAVLAGLAGAAGIAGTAQAVNLNPDGLGQVLIYPYYTVNGGNATLLSVVNTTEDAKAVKVRFLEAQNSQEVLDFNLYMSGYDVWTAAVVNAGGTPTLLVSDETCTVPDLLRDFGGSQAFLTFGLTDSGGGNNDISRTTEGHFEMIEMGTLEHLSDSEHAAEHVNGVPPATKYLAPTSERPCGRLVDAWSVGDDNVVPSADDGYWIIDPLEDMENPTGGLFGGASIVNVEGAAMFSYDARAVNGYAYEEANQKGPLHNEPGDERPNLNSGDIYTGYVFTDQGGVAWAEYEDSIDAVSYVFMHDAIMNEYVTGGDATANSEWVVTFPTKNFYVNGIDAPIAPFVSEWEMNTDTSRWEACEPVLLDTVWNQEEQITDLPGEDPEVCPPVVSPAPPRDDCGEPDVPFALCFETNVIRFGDGENAPGESEMFASSNYTNIDITALGFEAGWARIDLFQYAGVNAGGVLDGSRDERPGLGYDSWWDGQTQYGLPATGFWAFEAHTGYLDDGEGGSALGNYGGLFNHKATRCFYGIECRDDTD